MPFILRSLPYARDSLAPYLSKETLDYHYGKHHATYVEKLNKLIKDSEWEHRSLEEIICATSGSIFNNAAQVWNHDFYWQCLTNQPDLQEPVSFLQRAIQTSFGSWEKFNELFTQEAINLFGSGWVWLVKNREKLGILTTTNAETPLTSASVPLLVCDVWEHAYYIDYRNARADYLEKFWQIVNWNFVSENFNASS